MCCSVAVPGRACGRAPACSVRSLCGLRRRLVVRPVPVRGRGGGLCGLVLPAAGAGAGSASPGAVRVLGGAPRDHPVEGPGPLVARRSCGFGCGLGCLHRGASRWRLLPAPLRLAPTAATADAALVPRRAFSRPRPLPELSGACLATYTAGIVGAQPFGIDGIAQRWR